MVVGVEGGGEEMVPRLPIREEVKLAVRTRLLKVQKEMIKEFRGPVRVRVRLALIRELVLVRHRHALK